jgi:uncharacterized glyoxalase superfamily protein PhnB
MANLASIELKAFVPAKDFELSKRFYLDLGFVMCSEGGGVAYFHHGKCAFLLMQFYDQSAAEKLSLHLLVEDVDAWWSKLNDDGIATKYGVAMTRVQLQSWRMRDFTLADPSGVCWRIGQNVS